MNQTVNTPAAPTSRLPSWLLPVCILAFTLIIIILPFHAFISTWGGTTIGPLLAWKSWKELLLAGIAPLVIFYLAVHPTAFRQLWSRPINKLIALYLLLTLIMAATSTATTEAILAGLLMNLRFLAIFVLAQIIPISQHPLIALIKSRLPTWLLWTAIILSIIAIAQVTLLPQDFLRQFGYTSGITIAPYTLLDDTPGALRAFATMRGPNTLGAYLIIPISLAAYLLIKRRHLGLSLVTLALSIPTLILTGSRSAWIGCIVALLAVLALSLPRPQALKILKITAAPLLIASLITLWAAVNVPILRLAIFHSSPGDPHLLEGSSQKHWLATSQGISQMFAAPLGSGIGTAGPASFYNNNQPNLSENYYVQIGQEAGLLGMALFIAISILVVRQLLIHRSQLSAFLIASYLGLVIVNIFLHGWADDPTAMTWWGIAGLAIAHQPRKMP